MNRDLEEPDKTPNQDLDWIAFCYIADELDGPAKSEFEARLENDELAQQAVVDAVKGSQLIYTSLKKSETQSGQQACQPALGQLTPVSLASRPRQRQLGRVRMIATAAAALLIAAAGWSWYSNQNNASVAGLDSENLAAAWVFTLVSLNDDQLDDLLEDEVPVINDSQAAYDDWMFVALTDLENSIDGAE